MEAVWKGKDLSSKAVVYRKISYLFWQKQIFVNVCLLIIGVLGVTNNYKGYKEFVFHND